MDSILKYNLLSSFEKKEVKDFIEFLFSKKNKKADNPESSDYKNRILSVSTWSDEDVKIFEENKHQFNK